MEIFIGVVLGGILTVVLLGVWCSLLVAGQTEEDDTIIKESKKKGTKKNGRK